MTTPTTIMATPTTIMTTPTTIMTSSSTTTTTECGVADIKLFLTNSLSRLGFRDKEVSRESR